jgi:hypothetical protein
MTAVRALIAALLLGVLSGCNGEKEIAHWISETESLKSEVVRLSGASDYATDDQQKLKTYFSRISELARLAQDDPRSVTALEKYILKGPTGLCQRVFVSRDDWGRIRRACEQDGYFLCAEEVRVYPQAIRLLREKFARALDCLSS